MMDLVTDQAEFLLMLWLADVLREMLALLSL